MSPSRTLKKAITSRVRSMHRKCLLSAINCSSCIHKHTAFGVGVNVTLPFICSPSHLGYATLNSRSTTSTTLNGLYYKLPLFGLNYSRAVMLLDDNVPLIHSNERNSYSDYLMMRPTADQAQTSWPWARYWVNSVWEYEVLSHSNITYWS